MPENEFSLTNLQSDAVWFGLHSFSDHILHKMDELGYDTRWCIIAAANVGALHKRGRTFMLSKNRNKSCHLNFESKES